MSKSQNQNGDLIAKITKILSKIPKNSRPRTRKTLCQHIKSLLRHKKMSEPEIDTLVDTLFVQKKISEGSDRLTYNL